MKKHRSVRVCYFDCLLHHACIATMVKEMTPVRHLRGVKTQRGHTSVNDLLDVGHDTY